MTYLKTSNRMKIRLFCAHNINPEGSKLQALYKLIQKKGKPIESEDTRYNNVLALEFDKGEYIAIKRAGRKDRFYPCAIQTIYLKTN